MGCTFFSVKFGNVHAYFCFVFTSQMALLFNKNILTEYILIARPNCVLLFLAGMETIVLHKKVSVYKVYSIISMNRTHLFLTVNTGTRCKAELHGILYRLLSIEFHGFTSRIDYHSLVPGLISICLEIVWVPLISLLFS